MTAKSYLKVSPSTWKAIKYIYVKVTPSTWKKVKNIYVKVTQNLWKATFGDDNSPIQITKPKLVGTGRVGTTVTRSSGTYSNYNSLITKIFYTTEVAEQVSGSITDPSGGNVTSTNPYTITEYDANPPPYYFYARDEVLGIDGLTYYYYSTPPIEAQLPSLSDDFNRTVSVGLGTASGGFTYSGPSRGNDTWSVNGSRAVNNSGDLGNNPMKTVDSGSFDQSVSVDTFKGGLGIAVWVASTSSFWSVVPDYTYILNPGDGFIYRCSTLLNTIYDPNEDCPPLAVLGSNPQSSGYTFSDVGLRCSPCTVSTDNVTSYPCTLPATTLTCPDTGPLGGDRCTACTSTTDYPCTSAFVTTATCPDFGSVGGDRCTSCEEIPSTSQQLTCSGSDSGGSCPNSGTVAGSRCSSCTSTQDCGGSITTTSCPDTGPNVGDRCGTCSGEPESVTQKVCEGSGSGGSCPSAGTNVGDRCNDCSSSTSNSNACTGTISNASSCPETGPNAGDRCTVCTPSTSTSYGCTGTATYASSQTTNGGLCSSARVGQLCSFTGTTGLGDRLRYNYTVCQGTTVTKQSYGVRVNTTTTTYTWPTYINKTTTTTYYTYKIREQGYKWSTYAWQDVTTYTYKYKVRETTLGYTYDKRDTVTELVTTKTYYAVEEVAADTYTYYSQVKLYQFVGASPTLIDSKIIATFENEPGIEFNTTYYIPINSVQAQTSGNTITATGNTSNSSGSVSYVYGGAKGTYVGVIAMAAVTNQGNMLDNFSA